ncbi:flavodoxin domain-containing protein [Spongisporangium articulatum]|uniref:Flavodoxin domain-containing protein n=1 Tax=Spongisporangium articulatum TaxID=3362603 RepID=A0ABW8AN46_9ACTN
MSVLVAVATRHGSTEEIADRIGSALAHAGLGVDVVRLPEPGAYGPRPAVEAYDAVVVGSAVYFGQWLRAARDFVRENRQLLEQLPVWSFSSGPVESVMHRDQAEVEAAPDVVAGLGVVQHRTFAGRLRRDGLGRGERVVVAALRASDEDDRDWAEIDGWARSIADVLVAWRASRTGAAPGA